MGTKNNPKNRGLGAKKQFNGKDIVPIMYYGKTAGKTNYLSAKYDKTDDIILGEDKMPVKWDSL